MPQVGVIVGSASDHPVMEDTMKTLEGLGIEAELVTASAHRNPERVREWVATGGEISLADLATWEPEEGNHAAKNA